MGGLRVATHSLALTITNLVGIAGGFLAYRALGAHSQLVVQLPTAVVCSVGLYIAWCLLTGLAPFNGLAVRSSRELAVAYVCSLAWNPVVFVPLHYITQGYLTSVGNIIGMLLFQVPVNALAVSVGFWARRAVGDTPAVPATPPGR